MKNQILSFVLIFLPCILFAQLQLTGKITTKENKAVELIEVQISNKDSILVNSVLTDEQGKFSLSIDKGDYLLIVKQLGAILHKQSISLNESLDLGNISITQQQQLRDVIVTQKKKLIERKVDRLIFNVENSISATGGDALDALKITPNIRIQNDKIAMIGKSEMLVMINGKMVNMQGESLINYLKSISYDDIKNIEVITTPPAKYDADGNSGLININFKKLKNDENFNATIRNISEQRTYFTNTTSGGINYRKNKIELSSNLSYKNGTYKITENHDYFFPDQTWKNNNIRKEYNNNISGRLSIDYKISEKQNIGIIYNAYLEKPKNDENNITKIYNQNDKITNYYTNTVANRHKKEEFHNININFSQKIDTLGKSLSLNFDYLLYNQNLERTFNLESFISNNLSNQNANNIGNQKINIFTGGLDFELPYKIIKLTTGTKFSFINTNNDFKFYNVFNNLPIIDENQSNEFNYKENIQAIYISAEKSFKKWDFQLGLRLENVETKGFSQTLNNTYENNYLKLFPTFYAGFKQNDNNNWSFNYSKRIGRPSYYMANPFRVVRNQFTYVEGNPYIQPEFVNNIEFSHTYKNNLNTKLSFMYVQDGKSQVDITDPNSRITKSTYLNFFKVYSYNFTLSYTFNKIKWFETFFNASFNYDNTIANEILNNQNIKIFSYYASTSNTFYLNKNKTFLSGLDINYQSPYLVNIVNLKEVYSINISFRYLLYDKNLQIGLVLNDLFRTQKDRFSSSSNNTTVNSSNYYDNQIIRLSVLYRIGNKKVKVKQKKNANGDEEDRIYGGN